MCSKPREKTVAVVRDKLTEKMHRVSNAVSQLGDYVNVVSASCTELQNVSRLLSSGVEAVMKTLHVEVLERLMKTSQDTVALLEDKRTVCEKAKQDGQQVSSWSHCVRENNGQVSLSDKRHFNQCTSDNSVEVL